MPPKKSSKQRMKSSKQTKSVDPQVAQINYRTYMFQVLERVPPVICEGLVQIYEDATNYCRREKKDHSARFKVFQQLLSGIPKWEEDEIADETERFEEQVPWLRSVLQQMIVAQVHILLSVRNDRFVSNPQFMFEMPTTEEIVYHLMCKSAKAVKAQVRLFDHTLDDEIVETNTMEIEEIIRRSLERAIHTLVPIEQIVNEQYGQQKKRVKEKRDSRVSESSSSTSSEKDVGEEMTEAERKKLERQHEVEQQLFEQREAEKTREMETHEEVPVLELVNGEEHVDEQPQETVDSLIEQLESMDKNDPLRKNVKQKLKTMLLTNN